MNQHEMRNLAVGDRIIRYHSTDPASFVVREISAVYRHQYRGAIRVDTSVIEATGQYAGRWIYDSLAGPSLSKYELVSPHTIKVSSLDYNDSDALSDEDKLIIKEYINGSS